VLSDEERRQLGGQGLPLVHRERALRRERALWRAVTGAGEVRITYRTADPSGTPLMPSLMVPPHDPGSELPRTRDPWNNPATPAQANRLAAHRLFEGRVKESIAPASEDLVRHALLVAVAESHRDTGHDPLHVRHPAYRPNPWNGELRDPRVLAWLTSRFNDDTLWSASALETYAKNPFVFLVKRVLRLGEVVEAEEETTPLVFGAVAHDLLERFYSLLKDDLPLSFDRRAETAFAEAAAEVIVDREFSDEWTGAPLLWHQECDAILGRVRDYLVWELGHLAEKGERPFLIEHEFGGDGGVLIEGVDARNQAASLRLRGRIDRVDLTGEGLPGPEGSAKSNVLDYKSGKTPSANDYVDGTALQAPLYMQALENSGHHVGIGFYRSLKKSGSKYTQYAGKIRRREAKYDAALRFALSIPARVRAGMFEPVRSLRAGKWPAYEPDRGVARSAATLLEGNRFDV
jgi:RecB family exonuclease